MTPQSCHTIEVCFSPALYPGAFTKPGYIAVVVDILRASTTICAAFEAGVEKIIPVPDLETALEYKNKGYLVAAEEDGIKPAFADFGNSAFEFMNSEVRGKTIVHCTTNGTKAISLIQNADSIAIGSFVNLTALSEWLVKQDKNIFILCSGWKNRFSLEDAFFAGALVEKLGSEKEYTIPCDSANAALVLWKSGRNDMLKFVDKALHRLRLKKLGLDNVLHYTFAPDSGRIIPVVSEGIIRGL